ncbi:MAG: glycine cleavage system protein GcvH [Chloroflexi bacterium]|nr:glycine cleavage system protein GcvH [Chloroflexota bacterium]
MTPDDRKYSKEHEWALVTGIVATVGITQFATESLGDVVFVDLPEVGSSIEQFGKFGEVESVKAVSDLFSPVSGTITERNDAVIDDPEVVNKSPYEAGWLLKVELSAPSEIDDLMGAADYDKLTAEEG